MVMMLALAVMMMVMMMMMVVVVMMSVITVMMVMFTVAVVMLAVTGRFRNEIASVALLFDIELFGHAVILTVADDKVELGIVVVMVVMMLTVAVMVMMLTVRRAMPTRRFVFKRASVIKAAYLKLGGRVASVAVMTASAVMVMMMVVVMVMVVMMMGVAFTASGVLHFERDLSLGHHLGRMIAGFFR